MLFTNLVRYCSTASARNWKILGLNHVAVATQSVDKALHFYENVLGAKVRDQLIVPTFTNRFLVTGRSPIVCRCPNTA